MDLTKLVMGIQLLLMMILSFRIESVKDTVVELTAENTALQTSVVNLQATNEVLLKQQEVITQESINLNRLLNSYRQQQIQYTESMAEVERIMTDDQDHSVTTSTNQDGDSHDTTPMATVSQQKQGLSLLNNQLNTVR